MSVTLKAVFQDIKIAGYVVTVGLREKYAHQVDPGYMEKLGHTPKESLKSLVNFYLEDIRGADN